LSPQSPYLSKLGGTFPPCPHGGADHGSMTSTLDHPRRKYLAPPLKGNESQESILPTVASSSSCGVSYEPHQCCRRTLKVVIIRLLLRVHALSPASPETNCTISRHEISADARLSSPQSVVLLGTPMHCTRCTCAVFYRLLWCRTTEWRWPPTKHRLSATGSSGRTLPPPVSINCIDLR